MKNHICERENIKWDDKPVPSDNCIEWQGVCEVCGRRVFEVYRQMIDLYDCNTGETI